MTDPQLENGYVKIANELFDALCRIRIAGEQRQCLDVIIRKTYGFNKKSDCIALSQFVNITGIRKQNVKRALIALESKNIITVINKDNDVAIRYRINKNYASWEKLSKKSTYSIKSKPVLNNDHLRDSKKSPTKDNITKDNITKDNTPKKSRKKNKTKCPDVFPVTQKMIDYARKKKSACSINHLEDITEKFLLNHRSKGSTFADWYAAWQLWFRNDLEWKPDKHKQQSEHKPLSLQKYVRDVMNE
jgi:phage replication O-like protein O